jgi:hypothetical protein
MIFLHTIPENRTATMTDASLSPEAGRYLVALAAALAPAPSSTRNEIVAGVREELLGLDPAQTRERIAELGDPEFIAATALAELSVDRSVGDSPAPARSPAPEEARWFSTTAGLLLLIGSIVVPVVAPIIGYIMVWKSRAWTTAEKWGATLAPFAIAVIVLLGSAVATWATRSAGASPTGASTIGGLAVWHSAVLAVFVSPVAAGAWLLWRATRNRAADDEPLTTRPVHTA